MLGVRATLQRLEPMIVRIDAAIPYLATKQEVALLRADMTREMAADRLAHSKARAAQRQDATIQFAQIREKLARKPSTAGMWTMAIALVTLVVGAMGAGAVYLPFLFRVLHLLNP